MNNSIQHSLSPDVISLIFFVVSCAIAWMTGRLFRRDVAGVSIPFILVGLVLAILFSLYIYSFGVAKLCEYLHCKIQGEAGWKYIFYSVLTIPVFWGLIIFSAKRKKRSKDTLS